jgi:hypothetical protein
MKMKALSIISLFTLMLVPHVTSAQPDVLWTNTFCGDHNSEFIQIQQTSDGFFSSVGFLIHEILI